MRRTGFAALAIAFLFGADQVAAASSARCELTGRFDGAPVPGATAVGTVRIDSPLALDLFGPNATHEVVINLTSTATGTSLSVSLGEVRGKFHLLLETRLGATLLSMTVDSAYQDRKINDVSLICTAAP
ncbi:hypothetical protein [Phreatobacter sp.]|uniref:hypothetical protein n=1 Tax=Phreatobacter sp. TaxID=1966341 RepID=UPI0025F896AF|nr:hypothetical protein [Phreatobacter sp.]